MSEPSPLGAFSGRDRRALGKGVLMPRSRPPPLASQTSAAVFSTPRLGEGPLTRDQISDTSMSAPACRTEASEDSPA